MDKIKKGDVVGLEEVIEAGEEIAHNLDNRHTAEAFIKDLGFAAEIGMDSLNKGKLSVVNTTKRIESRRAKVNWVVDEEMGISYLDTGLCDIVSTVDWTILVSAEPSYESKVEYMTEEQLRESIEELRGKRAVAPRIKVKGTPKPKMSKEDNLMQQALSGLSPEKKEALMKKLGMM